MKKRFPLLIRFALFLYFASSAHGQAGTGPMAPPPKYEAKTIPSEPHPGPPPIPEQEIIQKFAANEDVMKQQYDTYDFTETIRIEEMADPGGKFSVTGEVYTRPDGQRFLRVAKQPESDLKVEHFSMEDARTMASLPLFSLTSKEIGNYNFKYAGQEKLDQLTTYIFQVKPKLLSRKQRFFEGVIWVDDHDFAIVKSYGKFVSELAGNGTILPFTMFETYRENFLEKYWLPTYTRSDDYIKGPNDEEVPLRLVIRSTDFKPHNQSGENAAPATAPPSAPATAPQSAQPQPPAPN
ncbi:MAG: hypothetical protein ABSB66_10355 [Candidatus Acidiferrales bacterium]|jgi:hypothetical protein